MFMVEKKVVPLKVRVLAVLFCVFGGLSIIPILVFLPYGFLFFIPSLVLGGVSILVGWGLMKGSFLARLIAVVYCLTLLFWVVHSVYMVFYFGSFGSFEGKVFVFKEIIFGVVYVFVGLYLLFSREAKEFFS